MYPISQSTLQLLNNQYRQTVEITMQTTDGTLHITENDILQRGLKIDRYCMSGNRIEIGSAVASELSLNLNNADGRFDNVTFEGAELYVKVGIKKWDAAKWENATISYIPCGYFTVDSPPRKLKSISLTALDRMVAFDKPFDNSISFPISIAQLLQKICTDCGVPLGTQANTLINYDYSIPACPDIDFTYRNALQWIGEITGTCAYIDWEGQLRMEWYKPTTTIIDKTARYTSDLMEDDIIISGVQLTDNEDNKYLSGEDNYAIRIDSNPFIQCYHQALIDNIYLQGVRNFTYRPYKCTIKSMPHLYPLDVITYKDNKDEEHTGIISHYTFTLNGNTSIAGKGDTATKNGYATANPLTAKEAAIIAKLKNDNDVKLSSQKQATLALNETIANSLGLYITDVLQNDGSTVYYYHNASTLAGSNAIYTLREGGFAWTNAWNDGNPTWNYGFDRNGNAVLQAIYAYKITTDDLDAGSITADKLSVGLGNTIAQVSDTVSTRIIKTLVLWTETWDAERADKEKVHYTTQDSLYHYYDKSTQTWKTSATNTTGTAFLQTADKFLLTGLVEIDGDLITKGTISADRVSTDIAQVNETLNIGSSSDDETQKRLTFNETTSIQTATAGTADQYALEINANMLYTPKITIEDGAAGSFPQLSSEGFYSHYPYPSEERSFAQNFGMTDSYSAASANLMSGMHTVMQTKAGDASVKKFFTTLNAGGELILDVRYRPDKTPNYTGSLWHTWFSESAIIVTSDRNLKNTISDMPDKYDILFDNLNPVTFKYNTGESGRLHTGFIAQDVEAALQTAEIPSSDFAGWVSGEKTKIIETVDENGNTVATEETTVEQGLRYEEFIALNTKQIQKLKARVSELEERISALENLIK